MNPETLLLAREAFETVAPARPELVWATGSFHPGFSVSAWGASAKDPWGTVEYVLKDAARYQNRTFQVTIVARRQDVAFSFAVNLTPQNYEAFCLRCAYVEARGFTVELPT